MPMSAPRRTSPAFDRAAICALESRSVASLASFLTRGHTALMSYVENRDVGAGGAKNVFVQLVDSAARRADVGYRSKVHVPRPVRIS